MTALTHTDRYRPQVHFTAQRNWINDPNGLVYWAGEYHLFYQYNPFGDQWGHMSWGHAVSTDLIHWTELPVAIPEDERASIFSGSVVIDTHNTSGFGNGIEPPMVAIYTGCLRIPEGGQAQELAYSLDCGRTWTAYADNPVLDLGLKDFRDPKVFWHAPTARWIMLVSMAHEYRLAFFESDDLKAWKYLSDFKSADTKQGIWECPDIFVLPMDGETPVWVLKVDVLEGHPSEGSGARVFFGYFDGIGFRERPEMAAPWADYGADFYAAVVWANTEAVRPTPAWIGWMNCHRYAKYLPTSPWRGAMSLPRALSVRRTSLGLTLVQQPIPEVLKLREHLRVDRTDVMLRGEQALLECTPTAQQGAMEIRLVCSHSNAQMFGGIWRTGPTEYTRWGYDLSTGNVFVDRRHSGFVPDDATYAKGRRAPCPAPTVQKPLVLHAYIDRCSIELFVNEGEIVLTEQVFPAGLQSDVALFSEGDVTVWDQAQVWLLARAH